MTRLAEIPDGREIPPASGKSPRTGKSRDVAGFAELAVSANLASGCATSRDRRQAYKACACRSFLTSAFDFFLHNMLDSRFPEETEKEREERFRLVTYGAMIHSVAQSMEETGRDFHFPGEDEVGDRYNGLIGALRHQFEDFSNHMRSNVARRLSLDCVREQMTIGYTLLTSVTAYMDDQSEDGGVALQHYHTLQAMMMAIRGLLMSDSVNVKILLSGEE